MPALELSGLKEIETALILKIELKAENEELWASDYYRDLTYDGYTIKGLGSFLSISNSTSELRTSIDPVKVGISGIPNSVISKFLTAKIKGANVKIARGLIDPVTKELLPKFKNGYNLRFIGYVENFEIQEQYDVDTRTATNSILLNCNSFIDLYANKYAGRRTNPADEKFFFPNDLSFDRVPDLVGVEFNFGGPAT